MSRLSSAHRFQYVFGLVRLLQPIGNTMVLTPASRHLGRQVSPLFSLHLSNVPPPTTPCNPSIALHAISAYRVNFRLRQGRAGSSSHTAESSSLYCGPPVRLQLLSTPPRGDAVTFSYRVLAYPDTDSHRANVAPSRAHSPRHSRGFAAAATSRRIVETPVTDCLAAL